MIILPTYIPSPRTHMMVTLYRDIPMYLLSLRAATWTDLVSQARKAPNSWNVSIKKFKDLLPTLTTTVYFQTSFIFIVFWAHNLRPEHKSENRRLLQGNRTTSWAWLIFAIKHIHTHYAFMRLVMQNFPTNELSLFEYSKQNYNQV